MAQTDSDGDAPNPSKSFNAGAADRLSGFFTPVWESKRRRAESERGSNRPPSSKPGGAPPSVRGAAVNAGGMGTDSSRPAPPPARKSDPPRPQVKASSKAAVADGAAVAASAQAPAASEAPRESEQSVVDRAWEPAVNTQLTGTEPRIVDPAPAKKTAERKSEPAAAPRVAVQPSVGAAEAGPIVPAVAVQEPAVTPTDAPSVAAAIEAPAAARHVELEVEPEPATRLRTDAPAHPLGAEPLRPRPRNDSPVPEARRIAMPVVLRDTLASNGASNVSTSVPSSAFSVHQDVPVSDWDSSDTTLKQFAKGEGPTPEAQLSHLLRRLRRTIPLYAPLPERIKKLIEDDNGR